MEPFSRAGMVRGSSSYGYSAETNPAQRSVRRFNSVPDVTLSSEYISTNRRTSGNSEPQLLLNRPDKKRMAGRGHSDRWSHIPRFPIYKAEYSMGSRTRIRGERRLPKMIIIEFLKTKCRRYGILVIVTPLRNRLSITRASCKASLVSSLENSSKSTPIRPITD